MNKEKKTDKGVHVIDNTKPQAQEPDVAGAAKAALAALSPEQCKEILQDLGLIKLRANGPDPRKLFAIAKKKLYARMPEIKGIVDGCAFPTACAITVGVDPEGFFFANLKRVRNKYAPRKSTTSSS